MSGPLQIAIVGLAGCYPEARDARTYWRNILARVDAVTDADPDWIGPYFEENTTADDRTYTVKGGFLRDLARVDPQAFGVMPSVAAGSDPDHLITLKLARDALADAGYLERAFDRERAGIIIGRGTYGNRALGGMLARGFFFDQMLEVVQRLRPDFSDADLRELRAAFKQQLPPHTGEHVGVLTPNVIAGLVANRLDLMGPSYIVDAACASTMMALEAAVRELQSGRCDLMLTGGVHSHTPPQLFIQFCLINALSRGRIRPFQKGADGTLLGEGAGLLVLKRLADAERDGDRVYAVIQGIGTASDGRAKGLLAPRLEGQVLAIRRAYQSSGIDPHSIDLIEAHGTGTPIGDLTEIQALSAVFGGRGAGPKIALSAVKSMIGHCMPASGAAALIKTALALHHKVLPPMLCDEPDPELHLERTPFYINTQARPWLHGQETPRRAAADAFGFGGINSHVILEEHAPTARSTSVSVLHAPGRSELVLLGAASAAELAARARQALAHLRGAQPATLEQIAAACARIAQGEHRLALVATGSEDLQKKLEEAIGRLEGADCAPFRTRGGVHYGVGAAPGKLCFLFPGEGSQYPGMLADLCMSFPSVRDWFDVIEQNAIGRGAESRAAILYPAPTLLDEEQRQRLERRLFDMDVAAESVFAASLGLYALFSELGFQPQALLGHSTGENTALAVWTRGATEHRGRILEAVRSLGALYRRLDAGGQILSGTLLTVGALKPATHAALLADSGELVVAMDNCPNQLVLFGSPQAAQRLQEKLAAEGAVCAALPFGRAYHTPAFRPMAEAILKYYSSIEIAEPLDGIDLYSACSTATFPRDTGGICALTARQWESPVRFTQTIRRLHDDGYRVFVELGPSGNLTSFVGDILRGHTDVLALASNSRRKAGVDQLHATLAQLHAAGVRFDAGRLFANRDLDAPDLLEAPRAPGRALQPLTLRMPTVRLPEKFARPLPAGAAAVPVAAATPATVAATAASADPRSAALQAHFALMQEFLDSQARVMGLAGVAAAVGGAHAPAPLAPSPMPMATTPVDPDFPLLGREVTIQDGRLVAEREFDLAHDLVLLDHAIGARPSTRDLALRPLSVIPFTFSMELIAEAAVRLDGRPGQVVVAVENARGSRWLSLDDGRTRLRIVAQRETGEGPVGCRVFLLGATMPAEGMLVFEGSVRLAGHYPAAPAAPAWPSTDSEPPHWHTPGNVYRHGMFHGPRLQGCTQVRRWGPGGMEANLAALPTDHYFAGVTTPRFQFDAALLDAAGQLAGFWLRERHADVRNCFPFRVRSLQLYAPPPPGGTPVECRGRIRMEGATQLEARWDLLDRSGRLLMRADGWEDRVFSVPDRFAAFRANPSTAPLSSPALADRLPSELCLRHLLPLPAGLLEDGGGIWMRVVAHMCLGAEELRDFAALPARGPRREEWLLGRLVAKDAVRDWYRLRCQVQLAPADVQILADPGGAPRVHCTAVAMAPPCVSLSHSRGHACAVAGDAGVSIGLDYQRIENLRLEALVQGALVPEEVALISTELPAERLRRATALWTAKEAAAKAAGTGLLGRPRDWVVVAARLDRRADEPTVARVRHAGRDHDVALHFDPDNNAVLALCVAQAGADVVSPHPSTETPT